MSAITHQQLVENYIVIRVLGEGSFGKVFLVRHKDTKIQFAMKKYSKYHILKNGKQRALIRSSRILQCLDHKNIIKFLYYAIGDQDDQIFLIFQACKKGSLQEIKQKIFNMKQLDLVKQIMYQLIQGLQYLKSVSVAHRDMKPSNLSFNSEGELKIIDFDEAVNFKQMQQLSNQDESFAKQLMDETSSMKMYSRRSRANSFVGTELYMSPQMRNMAITDERGDIWGYGCIFFQLVAGRSFQPQYQQDDSIQLTLMRVSEQLSKFIKDQSQIANILDLLKNILQQSPENRFTIDKIINHNFFRQFKDHRKRHAFKTKLRKFLKGNYNLSDPRNVLDALNMDLIGMKAGKQKFLQLSQYPVLLRYEKNYLKPKTFATRVKELLRTIIQLPKFKVSYLFGGSRYFKQRSALKEQQKSYILYDEIDTIKVIEDSIIIQGSNCQKWNTKDAYQQMYSWRFTLKSITGDHYQLGILYDMLLYIWND